MREGAASGGGAPRALIEETHMKTLMARLVREDDGQDLIEYALLLGIIVVGTITLITSIGNKVNSYFTAVDSNLPTR
jgi:pilus assembly protein Flp/PilA